MNHLFKILVIWALCLFIFILDIWLKPSGINIYAFSTGILLGIFIYGWKGLE